MEIKILGTGCAKCKKLYAETEKAVAEAKVDATIVKVEDMKEIVGYGVMMTPALVIDGKVRLSGKVINADGIKKLIQE